MSHYALTLLVAMIGASANAQSMIEADMIGQPLSYGKNGVVTGCGLRVVGVISPVPGSKTFRSFDISANFWKSGAALVKMIGETNTVSDAPSGKGTREALRNGWIKAEGKSPAAPNGETFKESTEDKNAYLFPVALDGSVDFIIAAMKGNRVQVGINWSEPTEWIYTGTIHLEAQEKKQIAQCFGELSK
jgi:hypothetical protein